MSEKSITGCELRTEIAEKVIRRLSLPQQTVDAALRALPAVLADGLATGGRAEFRGFGSFRVKYMPSIKSRNPSTGDDIVRSERYKVAFRASKFLSSRIQKDGAGAKDAALPDTNDE